MVSYCETCREARKYNGWANYETWSVNLCLTNEQGSSEYWNRLAQEIVETARKEDRKNREIWTDYQYAKFTLAERLKDEIEDMVNGAIDERKDRLMLASQLMGGALSEVEWNEVAAGFLEELIMPDPQKVGAV